MDEFERIVYRFANRYRPYAGIDIQAMLCDFEQLEEDGVSVVAYRRTEDPGAMIEIVVRKEEGIMRIIESRWRGSLRLSDESVHVVESETFRFATRGSGDYITGRVLLVTE